MVATRRIKFARDAKPSQYIVPFGNAEPIIWTLYGHGGSGTSGPDREIQTQSNLYCLMVTKGSS